MKRQELNHVVSAIPKKPKKAFGKFVWIETTAHYGSNALKARITDITAQIFGNELVWTYVTEGDFATYIPRLNGFNRGAYLTKGSKKCKDIAGSAMIGTKKAYQKKLAQRETNTWW